MEKSTTSVLNEVDVLRDLSEEEKQVIAHQKQRSDKISSLMGQYLLKGWRMLNESCPKCGTILFLPRTGEKYCIGCSEVDVESPVAGKKDETNLIHLPQTTAAALSQVHTVATGDCSFPSRTHIDEKVVRNQHVARRIPAKSSESSFVVNQLQEKLLWCTSRLAEAKSPEEIGQWAEAIRCLAEATDAVSKCSVLLN